MPKNIIDKIKTTDDIATLWGGLDDAGKTAILENLVIRRFKKNDFIYHESDNPYYLYYLISGKVKLLKGCNASQQKILRTVNVHKFLGYRAFLASEPHNTSAKAFDNAIIGVLPTEIVTALMGNYPGIGRYFMKELTSSLAYAGKRIVALTQKHIRGRLADTLLSLKDEYGVRHSDNTLDIDMSRNDLASMSNMSTSNAIRTLSAFAAEKLIAIEGKRICLLDENGLAAISDLG